MQTEVKFSSKRFLLALLLCACSVILLQNNDLSPNASFTFNAICIAAGLAVCFLFFLPSLILKKRTDSDVLTLARRFTPKLRIPIAVFYALYFVYAALYFLLPYIDMFHTKYFPEVTPCLITFIMLLGCAYAACKGVNVISRFGIFLFLFALLTNILMFGGSLSELDFSHYSFELNGDFNVLCHAVIYSCDLRLLLGCDSEFPFPPACVYPDFHGIKVRGGHFLRLVRSGRLRRQTDLSCLCAFARCALRAVRRNRELLSRSLDNVGVYDSVAVFMLYLARHVQ